jgi:hypothetical protein
MKGGVAALCVGRALKALTELIGSGFFSDWRVWQNSGLRGAPTLYPETEAAKPHR